MKTTCVPSKTIHPKLGLFPVHSHTIFFLLKLQTEAAELENAG